MVREQGGRGGIRDFFNTSSEWPDQVARMIRRMPRLVLASLSTVRATSLPTTTLSIRQIAGVKLASDRWQWTGHPAKVVGVDKATDLAVIKIDADRPLRKLGNSEAAGGRL